MLPKKEYIRYIPAELPNFTLEKYLGEHTFKYWLPDARFHYPYMLFSMAFVDEDGLPDDVKNNVFVFGDSGGFQADKPEFMDQCQPHIVIEKQEANCDAGFILDKPPWKIGRDYDMDYFKRCARITKEDADIMYEKQTREDFRLYGIIQGRNAEEWDIWYDIITKDHDFDWWSFSPTTPSSVIGTDEVIEFAFWAKDRGIRDFHILGLAGKPFVPTLAYLVKELDLGLCTYDASTPLQAVEVFNTMLPRRFSRKNPLAVDFQYPFCRCPVCEMFDPQYAGIGKYLVAYNKVHTVYYRVIRCDTVNAVCDSKEDLGMIAPECKPYLERVDALLNGEEKKQGTLQLF